MDATRWPVWALIREVRLRVHERFGVALEPEVRTAGFDAHLDPLDVGGPGPTDSPPTDSDPTDSDSTTSPLPLRGAST